MHRRAGGSPTFLSWNDQKRAGSGDGRGLRVGTQRRSLQQGHVQESQKPGSCQPTCSGSASASFWLLQRCGYKGGSREGAPVASQVLQKARGLRTPTPSSPSCLCFQGSLATTTNGRMKGDNRAQATSTGSGGGGDSEAPKPGLPCTQSHNVTHQGGRLQNSCLPHRRS